MLLQILLFCGLAVLPHCERRGASVDTMPQWSSYAPIRPSTPAAAQGATLQSLRYSVVDLVVPIQSRSNLKLAPLPCRQPTPQAEKPPSLTPLRMGVPISQPSKLGFMPWHGETTGDKVVAGHTLEADLIQTVVSRVAPQSWKAVGGRGTIQYCPLGMTLVVNQTPEVHKEVKALLESLHRSLEVQVALQVTIAQVSPACLQRVREEMSFDVDRQESLKEPENPKWIVRARGERWTASLSNDQVQHLLRLAQNDRATTVMQAPRVTMFNGQIEGIEVSGQTSLRTDIATTIDGEGNLVYKTKTESVAHGLRLVMQPVVSRDGRSVRVAVNGYWSAPVGPAAVIPVQVPVAPGGSPSLPRFSAVNTDQEHGAPEAIATFLLDSQQFWQAHVRLDADLSDGGPTIVHAGVISVSEPKTGLEAFVSWLTGGDSTTRAERHLLFMVTPRILVNEE